MIHSLETSFVQLLSITVLPVIFISCELTNNPQGTPSSQATLSDIRIVERPKDASETDDYFLTELEPEFHSDTFFYTVTADTAFVLGIQPVPTSSEASISVSLDGETISTKKWTDSEEFFTCPNEHGKNTRSIVITVTAEDGKTKQAYSIEVTFFTPPSSDATLSDIVTVQRPDGDSDNEDYVAIPLSPEFQSGTHSYSVTIDTGYVLGIQPVATSSRASISVTLDGDTVSASAWAASGELFTCNYKSGTDTRDIEISVTAEDGTSGLSYTIRVRYTYDSLQVPPDSLDTPSSDATLSDIQTIVRPYTSEGSTIVDLQPDFDPEIHSYSVRIATGNQLGIRPVTTSAEASVSVVTTWDGPVTAEKHDGSDVSYYWANKQSGYDYTKIEISVIAGDKKTMSVYIINVSYYTDTLSVPPANCATLSDMLTVARYVNNSYHSPIPLTPVFRPDSLSYSVELDSAWILGVQPVASSLKASTVVLLDGVAIDTEVWPDSAEFFTCTPPAETNTRTIEITVTAEDKETRLTYRITVKRRKPYTSTPCYLDEMPMAKWISDTSIMCGSRCGYVRYFGFEEVQPSPQFTANTHEYLVHIGDFNFFGVSLKYDGYYVWCSVEGTTEIFRRMYDPYYYIKRPNGSKETDTIKIVTSDSCETPSEYTVIVTP